MPGASLVRFVALAALIVSVALALWLLDVGRVWIVAGVVAAWAISSVVEWVSWSRYEALWPGEPPGRPPGHESLVPSPPPAHRAAVPAPLPYPVPPVLGPSHAPRVASSPARPRVTADRAEEQDEPRVFALPAGPAPRTGAPAPRPEPATDAASDSAAERDPEPSEAPPQPAPPAREPAPAGSAAPEAGSEPERVRPAVPPPVSPEPAPRLWSRAAGKPTESLPDLRDDGAHERSFRLLGFRVTLVTPSQDSEDETAPAFASSASQPLPGRELVSEREPEVAPEEEPEPVPEPESEPELDPVPEPVAPQPSVVRLDDRGSDEPRRWNLWQLERAARETAGTAVGEPDERSFLLLHLRQFAEPDGLFPAEFDELVRESFAPLIGELERA